jgi:hypothetical protein
VKVSNIGKTVANNVLTEVVIQKLRRDESPDLTMIGLVLPAVGVGFSLMTRTTH